MNKMLKQNLRNRILAGVALISLVSFGAGCSNKNIQPRELPFKIYRLHEGLEKNTEDKEKRGGCKKPGIHFDIYTRTNEIVPLGKFLSNYGKYNNK